MRCLRRTRGEPFVRGNIGNGAHYLVRGAKMLGHPSLRPFVIVPLAVNIAIFASLLTLGISAISDTLDSWIAAIPDWLSFLRWLVWPIVYIGLALVSGYLFTAVAILVASPFMGLLAEKAEELITGEAVAGPEGLMGALALFPRAIVRELLKFTYYLPLVLMVLLASVIPLVNALTPLLWFLLGAWMMSVQYVDYPMDNHLLDFADVKEALRGRRLSSLGFGGLVALASGIPLVNFFVMPAAVCGATLFWCEELRGRVPRGD
jgi:CysZ protein